ncbi:MAG: hypothetical protein J5601_00325 [Elusimicrobiaceae bacterium]|nr:hypothetical protein [Elusimicrobiaceae bacterium]
MKKVLFALFGLLFTTGILTPVYAQLPQDEHFGWVSPPSEEAVQQVAEVQRKNKVFKRYSHDKRIIRLGDLNYYLSEAVSSEEGTEKIYHNRHLLNIDQKYAGKINIVRHTDNTLPTDFQDYLLNTCSGGGCGLTNTPFGQERICSAMCPDSYVVSRFVPAADGYTYEFTVTDPTISRDLVPDYEEFLNREKKLFSIVQNTKPEVITDGFIAGDDIFIHDDAYYK